MCGSIAIPFRAAPAVSDICVSNDGPIRHYFPSRRRQAWTARARVTGISPLRGSLRAAPTCYDGPRQKPLQRSTLWPDRSIAPTGGHGHTRSRRVLIAAFLARYRKKQNTDRKLIRGAVWLFHPAGRGAAAKVAFAHRIAYGNVLDEWVWGCQGTLDHSPHKRREGREFLSLYLLPHSKPILQGTI